jgi:hypothetical protein
MIETAAADAATHPGRSAPLVLLISSFGGKSYTFNVAYGVGKVIPFPMSAALLLLS